MRPDKKIVPLPTPEADEEAKLNPSPSPPHNARFLFKYVLILMSAALLFVLLSYLSHMQRQNERNWAEAQERQTQFSVSALQSIETLQAENKELLQQTGEDEKTIADLNRALSVMEGKLAESETVRAEQEKNAAVIRVEAEQAAQEAEKRTQALEALWRIEKMVSARQYTKARAALAEMAEMGLIPYLPDTPEEDSPDSLSAAGEYARLAEMLG